MGGENIHGKKGYSLCLLSVGKTKTVSGPGLWALSAFPHLEERLFMEERATSRELPPPAEVPITSPHPPDLSGRTENPVPTTL